jgi:hypothetical protein
MKQALLLATLCVISHFSYANSPFPAAALSKIIIHDNGTSIILVLSPPFTSLEGCGNVNELILKTSHPLFNPMYSTLLSAFHAGTKFSGWVNGCDPQFQMPILTRIDMSK